MLFFPPCTGKIPQPVRLLDTLPCQAVLTDKFIVVVWFNGFGDQLFPRLYVQPAESLVSKHTLLSSILCAVKL